MRYLSREESTQERMRHFSPQRVDAVGSETQTGLDYQA